MIFQIWNNGNAYIDDGGYWNTRTSFIPDTPLISVTTTISCGDPTGFLTNPQAYAFTLTITAAPGESFADNIKPGTGPLEYVGASVGVALTYSGRDSNFSCIDIDQNAVISRIQIKCTDGGVRFGGWSAFQYNILDKTIGSDNHYALWVDYLNTVSDNVIVCHGAGGCIGISAEYPNLISGNTIVAPASDGGIEIALYNPDYEGGLTASNNAIFGFAHPAAQYTGDITVGVPMFATPSDYNATDGSSADSGAGFGDCLPPNVGLNDCTAVPVGGSHTLFSEPFTTTTFVNPASDFRLASGSSLIGTGAAIPSNTTTSPTSNSPTYYENALLNPFSSWSKGTAGYPQWIGMMVTGDGISGNNSYAAGSQSTSGAIWLVNNLVSFPGTGNYTFSFAPLQTPDILGTARSSSYDIGAFQSTGTSPAGGGRLFFQ